MATFRRLIELSGGRRVFKDSNEMTIEQLSLFNKYSIYFSHLENDLTVEFATQDVTIDVILKSDGRVYATKPNGSISTWGGGE